MPCFDGLFEEDEYNDGIQDIIFSMASFHGFTKLRMHTDVSLSVFDGLTTVLGQDARYFANYICEELPAYPLAKEVAMQNRHQKKRRACSLDRAESKTLSPSRSTSQQRHSKHHRSCEPKYFNMSTFKWHNLGHYVPTIRMYGTLDLIGTPIVCILAFLMITQLYLG